MSAAKAVTQNLVPRLGSRVWLIGGTQESRQLAIALTQAAIPHLITVVTPAAAELYPPSCWGQIRVGAIAADRLDPFIQAHHIAAVLDASHPFALEISQAAIAACQHHNLPYLRYERPSTEPTPPNAQPSPWVHTVITYDDILQPSILAGERVLLTLGTRPLHRFQDWHRRATLFARILPTTQAIETALAAGFHPSRLIALRPPISLPLEAALWQQWQITQVITKASGSPGGEPIKRTLAESLGIHLWILERPPLDYPHRTEDLQQAIAFCCQQLNTNT